MCWPSTSRSKYRGALTYWSGLNFPSAGLLTHYRLALEYADLCRATSPFPFTADSLFRTVLWDFLEGNTPGGLRLSGTGGTKNTSLEKVLDLARLIRESDPDDRELDRLQSGRGYSPVYIRDLFKSHFGKTPRQYRTDLRLKKAGMLLKEGLSVKQTAGACGFPDELYFSRLFRKKVGISPSQFASEAEI